MMTDITTNGVAAINQHSTAVAETVAAIVAATTATRVT